MSLLSRVVKRVFGQHRLLAAIVAGVSFALVFWFLSALIQSMTGGGDTPAIELIDPPRHHFYSRFLASILFGIGASTLLLRLVQKADVEQALQIANNSVRSLVENLNEVVYSLNPAGEFTYISPVVERLTGFRPEELVGLHFSKVIFPEDQEALKERFARVLTGETGENATRVRTKDGNAIWIRTSSRVVQRDGQLAAITGVLTDITSLRQAEAQLRRLSRAVEASPSVVVITDVQGNIEYVNPKFSEITGYSLAEARGKNTRILKTGEMPPEVYKTMWETISAGQDWRGEFHNRRKDGTLYWEFASISPVRDDRGKIVEYVAVKEDITARKMAEQALTESEEKYRMLFSSQFDAVALFDAETCRYLEVNDAHVRLLGYSREELAAMTSLIVPDEEGTEEILCVLEVQHGPVLLENRRLSRKDGAAIPVDITLGAFTWKGRKVVFAVIRDITEKLRYFELLEKLSRTDALTGLANRRNFDERFEMEWRRAHRDKKPLSLIVADIDIFKPYNDTYGHLEGDDCLLRVAEAIRSVVRRPADLAARYGGEEFVVILTGTPAEGACAVAESLRAAVEALGIAHTASPVSPVVTLSVGVATMMPWQGGESEELIASADQALYRAKASGRNRVMVATDFGSSPDIRIVR